MVLNQLMKIHYKINKFNQFNKFIKINGNIVFKPD